MEWLALGEVSASLASLAAAWGVGYGRWSGHPAAALDPGTGARESRHTERITTDGIPTAQVQPGQGSGWLYLKQTGFKLSAGIRYIWRFQARADVAAGQSVNVPVSSMRDVSPWDGILFSTIKLTNQWQTFHIAVHAVVRIQDSGRVSLDVEFSPGRVYARNHDLVEAGQRGSARRARLMEAANVSLLGSGEGATPARMADYVTFLIATDRNYVNTAARHRPRRDRFAWSHHRHADGLRRPRHSRFAGRPRLPGQPLLHRPLQFPQHRLGRLRLAHPRRRGGRRWLVRFHRHGVGAPGRTPVHRQRVQPALAQHPRCRNRSRASPRFAAFQDWDAHRPLRLLPRPRLGRWRPNGFNINGDWTKFALIGQAAWLFRTGAVRAAAPLDVPVTAEERNQSATLGQSIAGWVVSRAGLSKETALVRAVELAPDSAAPVPGPSVAAEASSLTFDKVAKRFVLAAPMAAGIFGSAGGGRSRPAQSIWNCARAGGVSPIFW